MTTMILIQLAIPLVAKTGGAIAPFADFLEMQVTKNDFIDGVGIVPCEFNWDDAGEYCVDGSFQQFSDNCPRATTILRNTGMLICDDDDDEMCAEQNDDDSNDAWSLQDFTLSATNPANKNFTAQGFPVVGCVMPNSAGKGSARWCCFLDNVTIARDTPAPTAVPTAAPTATPIAAPTVAPTATPIAPPTPAPAPAPATLDASKSSSEATSTSNIIDWGKRTYALVAVFSALFLIMAIFVLYMRMMNGKAGNTKSISLAHVRVKPAAPSSAPGSAPAPANPAPAPPIPGAEINV